MMRVGLAVTVIVSLLSCLAVSAQAIFLDNYIYEEGGSWTAQFDWWARRYAFVNGVQQGYLQDFTVDKVVFTILWPETQNFETPYVTVVQAKQLPTDLTAQWHRTYGSARACVIEGPDLWGANGRYTPKLRFDGGSAPGGGLHIYMRSYNNNVLQEFADLKLGPGNNNLIQERYRDFNYDVPEPSTLLLLAAGGLGLAMRTMKKRS